MILDLLGVLGGIVLLVAGGEVLVRGAAALARAMGVSAMLVGVTVVAFGTSAPEFVVCVTAAWRSNTAIVAGNVVGSNILNVLLVLGATAVVYPLKAQAAFVRREIPVMVASALLLWLFARDGKVDRLDGALLLCMLAGYLVFTVRLARRESRIVAEQYEDMPQVRRRPLWLDFVLIVVGLIFLSLGSGVFLDGAVSIAHRFEVPEDIIGLTLVAGGTSFPELAACLVAAWRKHPDICLGNIIGSSIYNILGIAGTAAAVAPLTFGHGLLTEHLPVMVGSSVLLWIMVKTGLRVSRREGVALLTAYAVYFFWTARGLSAG